MSRKELLTVASRQRYQEGGRAERPSSLFISALEPISPATSRPRRRDVAERDLIDQAGWLAGQAIRRGYADLGDLLRNAPDVYMQLAVRWRRRHPLFEAA
jgi:hypothetical protein